MKALFTKGVLTEIDYPQQQKKEMLVKVRFDTAAISELRGLEECAAKSRINGNCQFSDRKSVRSVDFAFSPRRYNGDCLRVFLCFKLRLFTKGVLTEIDYPQQQKKEMLVKVRFDTATFTCLFNKDKISERILLFLDNPEDISLHGALLHDLPLTTICCKAGGYCIIINTHNSNKACWC